MKFESRNAALVGAALIAAVPAVEAAKDAPGSPLAPSSKWQLDYAPSECRLVRSFGRADQKVTLQIGRLDLDQNVELALAGHELPAINVEFVATVSTSTVKEVKIWASRYAEDDKSLGTFRFQPSNTLSAALMSDVASGVPTRLRLHVPRRYDALLDLGSFKEPLRALDACMDDLVAGWGLNPAEQRSRRSGPVPDQRSATWFKAEDYPKQLYGHSGIVVLRLLVGVEGKVERCAVSKAGGDKAFEALTCELATARAKFRPALDASGKPITSIWMQRIHWRSFQ
ncbi:MAG TPA: energy transducer TonB [Sphingomicrobium sp.]|jgi:hypothetical protein